MLLPRSPWARVKVRNPRREWVTSETIAGMGILSTILYWTLVAALGSYLVVAEFIDTIGRLEIVEKRWPRVWRGMNNRPFRLLLLIFLVILVARDVSERWKGKAECLTVVMPSIPAPIVQMVQDAPATGQRQAAAARIAQHTGNATANNGSVAQTGNNNSANTSTHLDKTKPK